jgi:hypothetical protein
VMLASVSGERVLGNSGSGLESESDIVCLYVW